MKEQLEALQFYRIIKSVLGDLPSKSAYVQVFKDENGEIIADLMNHEPKLKNE